MLVALLALPAGARADVVEPGHRPRECPRGAWAGFPHGTGPCTARPCADDHECFGNVCVDTALCLEGKEVVSACGPGDQCTRGRCVRAKRCAPKEVGAGVSGGFGCHCGVPTRRDDGLRSSLLALVAVVLGVRRRRRLECATRAP
jgi:MYXO-CTERM domain-containing protein